MSSLFDLDGSSDSEDDDYIPPGGEAADGNSELSEGVSDEEGLNDYEKPKPNKKKSEEVKNKALEQQSDDKIDKKTRADSIWESFLSDVGSANNKEFLSDTPVTKASNVMKETSIMSENRLANYLNLTVKANEKDSSAEVPNKVPEEKVLSSSEEKILSSPEKKVVSSSDEKVESFSGELNKSSERDEEIKISMKRSGLSSLIGGLTNKKPKLTTLEKTKLDWDEFKQHENIQEELQTFNKGKAGFVERQRFLERTDVRSFEVEKSLRQVSKKK